MPTTTTTTAYHFDRLFGILPGNSVFVAPADAEMAAEAFRSLLIRAVEGIIHDVNGFGVCPPGDGVPAVIFYVTTAARWKLQDARMVDPDRIIGAGC